MDKTANYNLPQWVGTDPIRMKPFNDAFDGIDKALKANADAIRLLDAHEAVAVDVREPDEYAVGHIPGAKLLPLGQVLTRAAEVLPDKNAVWLVYCRTGRRSADAVQKLESLGYTNLRDLGGILSWPYEIEGDFEGHF